MSLRCSLPLAMAFAFLWPGVAGAHLVGSPVPLEGVAGKADVIFKATAVSDAPTDKGGFEKVSGFATFETRLRVVDVMKGEVPKGEVGFLHYDVRPKDDDFAFAYEPQYYHLVPGKTYLVFALRQAWNDPALFRQLWMNPTGLKTQGVLLCADDQPLASRDVREVYWRELAGLLRSSDFGDVVYAIEMLDRMSGGGRENYDRLDEFPRERVLEAVKGLADSKDPAIAGAARMVAGGENSLPLSSLPTEEDDIMRELRLPGVVRMDSAASENRFLKDGRTFDIYARESPGDIPVGLKVWLRVCPSVGDAEKAMHLAEMMASTSLPGATVAGADESHGFSDALLVRKGRVVFLVENGRKDSPEYGQGVVAAKILDAMRRSGIE